MSKQQWEKVGEGSYDVYRPKPKKPFWNQVGEFIGGMIFIGIVLTIIGVVVS